jgi:hypothetical protein
VVAGEHGRTLGAGATARAKEVIFWRISWREAVLKEAVPQRAIIIHREMAKGCLLPYLYNMIAADETLVLVAAVLFMACL